MGSSGEAAYLEALKQEESLSQKSCKADVQVGMPAAGQHMCCRCQAVRWRLPMLQWQLQPSTAGRVDGHVIDMSGAGDRVCTDSAGCKRQSPRQQEGYVQIKDYKNLWCMVSERAAAGIRFRAVLCHPGSDAQSVVAWVAGTRLSTAHCRHGRRPPSPLQPVFCVPLGDLLLDVLQIIPSNLAAAPSSIKVRHLSRSGP